MEWIKGLSLKKAFFLTAFGGMLLSLLLAAGIWQACSSLSGKYPQGGVSIDQSGMVKTLEEPTDRERLILTALTGIQMGSLLLLPVCGLAAAAGVFYHYKLKPSITALRLGTKRIQEHDLDFTLPPVPEDELGEICAAFETMRAELLKTNRELWQQAEERKRLNAAFSHDLRNPITVLKGTVKLMRQGRADEKALERLESYTLRLEQYVEAMSGIQHLEQMPVKKKAVVPAQLEEDLTETAKLLAPSLAVSLEVSGGKESGKGQEDAVMIDRGIFLTVAENLIGNAARFSRDRLFLTLKRQEEFLILIVGDNGKGFPAELIEKGTKPFWRAESETDRPGRDFEETEIGRKAEEEGSREKPVHFGMGLYGCGILCRKHGGMLRIRDRDGEGGEVTAVFETVDKNSNV